MNPGVTIERLHPAHTDARGAITDFYNGTEPLEHVGLITFTPGAVRANHYHKRCTQYDIVLSGRVELAWKALGAPDAEIARAVLKTGDRATIPPETVHAYRALEDATMINLTTKTREGHAYEDDTFRVDPIL